MNRRTAVKCFLALPLLISKDAPKREKIPVITDVTMKPGVIYIARNRTSSLRHSYYSMT